MNNSLIQTIQSMIVLQGRRKMNISAELQPSDTRSAPGGEKYKRLSGDQGLLLQNQKTGQNRSTFTVSEAISASAVFRTKLATS